MYKNMWFPGKNHLKFLSGKCLTLFSGEEESGLDTALFTGRNAISERPVVKQTKQLQLSAFLAAVSHYLQSALSVGHRAPCVFMQERCPWEELEAQVAAESNCHSC